MNTHTHNGEGNGVGPFLGSGFGPGFGSGFGEGVGTVPFGRGVGRGAGPGVGGVGTDKIGGMPEAELLADAIVLVHEAYTPLLTYHKYGLLERGWALHERYLPMIKEFVHVSYGDARDERVAKLLGSGGVAAAMDRGRGGEISCVCNMEGLEPARFQAGVPERVAARLAWAESVIVRTDQHFGGEVAVAIAEKLRSMGKRVTLIARGGYHWSRIVARQEGFASEKAGQAAMLEGELCRASDLVVGTTKAMLEDLAWRHQIDAGRLCWVPNHILTKYEPVPVSMRERGLVLYAGRLASEKRLGLLIRAMAALPASVRGFARLMIVGTGPEEGRLRSLAAELGAPVEFRGHVPHGTLLRLMSRANVYAQMSAFEGHPKTVIEAMGCGTPVVVPNVVGMNDTLIPNVHAVVPFEDPGSVAGAIAGLLLDAEHAQRIANAGCWFARRVFNVESVSALDMSAVQMAMEFAQRSAHGLGRAGVGSGAGVVRWDQTLLREQPMAAAQTFARAIDAYAGRLEEGARGAFVEGLLARMPTAEVKPTGGGVSVQGVVVPTG